MFWRSWVLEKFCCSTLASNAPRLTGGATAAPTNANASTAPATQAVRHPNLRLVIDPLLTLALLGTFPAPIPAISRHQPCHVRYLLRPSGGAVRAGSGPRAARASGLLGRGGGVERSGAAARRGGEVVDHAGAGRAGAEQRRLDRAQTIDVSADVGDRVVEQERFGETHDRVGQRGGVHGRFVAAAGDLLVDDLLDQLDDSGLDRACAGGDDRQPGCALIAQEPAQ